MADRRRDRATHALSHSAIRHGVNDQSALTAAAQLMSSVTLQRPLQYETWQEEAWSFYENLGEFNYGVEWFGEALSRVRLAAAVISPGGDEPEILEDGPAVEIIKKLCGGTDGQSQLLRSLGVQLSVPGDAYFVGRQATQAEIDAGVLLDAEPDEDGRVWTVQPVNTLRRRRRLFRGGTSNWEIQVDDATWIPLSSESLVSRIWDRHEHFPWRAMSPAKAALPIMREIDMYNRHIVATLVSRVALNGLMLIPDEVTLPASPQYEDAADPFMAELLDVMMTAIKNPGSPAAAAPLPLRVPAEMIEKFKHFVFATPLDKEIFGNRTGALRRLATTLNLPAEIVTGMGDVNHWCVPAITKILTRDHGWVMHDQLNIGDVVLTLNHTTGMSEWQPVLDVYRADVIDEPVISIDGRFQSTVSTMQHRWPVIDGTGSRTWRTSETLHSTDRMQLSAPNADVPTEAKYTDAFVELVAWTTTEGSIRRWQPQYRGTMQTAIHQSHVCNPHRVIEIRRVLTELFGPSSTGRGKRDDIPRWNEHRYEKSGMTTWVLNRVATITLTDVMSVPDKIVSRDFIYALTRPQLELFIRTFIAGDGAHKAQSVVSSQRIAARLDALELAGTLLGYVTSQHTSHSNGFKAGDITAQSLVHPDNVVVPGGLVKIADRAKHTTYTGTIWCPVTSNTTWFAQHNGRTFFTGNSSWQLTEDAIKIHISPKTEIITRCLTVGHLHPMLKAMGEDLRDKDGNRIIVWYDVSELTQRPDRSESARALRDMLIISDAATRRENGFDESDAPTDDELEKMILMKQAGTPNPQLTISALKELTGLELEPPAPPVPPQAPMSGASEDTSGPVGDQDEAPGIGENTTRQTPKTRGTSSPTPNDAITSSAIAAARILRDTHSIRRRARQAADIRR